jgi:hypothetical protein
MQSCPDLSNERHCGAQHHPLSVGQVGRVRLEFPYKATVDQIASGVRSVLAVLTS